MIIRQKRQICRKSEFINSNTHKNNFFSGQIASLCQKWVIALFASCLSCGILSTKGSCESESIQAEETTLTKELLPQLDSHSTSSKDPSSLPYHRVFKSTLTFSPCWMKHFEKQVTRSEMTRGERKWDQQNEDSHKNTSTRTQQAVHASRSETGLACLSGLHCQHLAHSLPEFSPFLCLLSTAKHRAACFSRVQWQNTVTIPTIVLH